MTKPKRKDGCVIYPPLVAVRISKPHRDEPAVRHLQCLDESLGLAVLRGKSRDGVSLADSQSACRCARQALLPQRAGAGGLKDPDGLAAIRVGHLAMHD